MSRRHERQLNRTPTRPVIPPIPIMLEDKYIETKSGKPRVLLISDVRNWAFDQNLKDMAEYLDDEFEFDFWYIIEWINKGTCPNFSQYKAIFAPYHRWGIDKIVPWDKMLGSLRSLWFWPETPTAPGPKEFALVNHHKAFQLCTKRNYDELKDNCPNAAYLTNPINMNRFPKPTQKHDKMIASWNGNAKHYTLDHKDVKNFWPIIKPVCEIANIPLEYAEYNTKRLSPDQMPEFYQQSNVAICMSLYEGASFSTMEAMASGLALITTDCGNHREIYNNQIKYFGKSGIIILEHKPDSSVNKLLTENELITAISSLKNNVNKIKEMGKINRQEIIERWSWDTWKNDYVKFFKKATEIK